MPRSTVVAFVLASLPCAALSLAAQAPAGPQTYSLVELNSLIAPDMTVKIYRDGPREILLQTRPISAGSPKGYKGGIFYDFQAHIEFVWDATDGTPNCGKQNLTDTAAPSTFDVVSGSAEMTADLVKTKPPIIGHETIIGLPASIYNAVDTANQMSIKAWVSDKGNYLLKMTMASKATPPAVALLVQSLSFAKPPASAFTLPATCK